MSLVEQLADHDAAGVYRLSEPVAAIADAAQALDYRMWRVDCSEATSKDDLLRAIAATLAFPDWFGMNWDALEECLTDLSWHDAPGYVLVLKGCGQLSHSAPEVLATVLDIMASAAQYWVADGVAFWAFFGGVDPERFRLAQLERG